MREQLAAKPQSGSHPSSPVALLHQTFPFAESPQCPQRLPGIANDHRSMPMTLLQRLPGLQKAFSVRHGLSYLMDGARNLFAVVGDFNVHHKIPLDFFRELHILTVKKLMFPFYRGNPPPVLVGGCLIFYIAAQRGQPRYAAQLYLH